jgi:tetratricopeptide (TPR) repeat protein
VELDVAEHCLESIDAPRTTLLIRFTRIQYLERRGDYDAALALLAQATTEAERFSVPYFKRFLQVQRARLLLAKGKLRDSDDEGSNAAYDEAAEIYRALADEMRSGGDRQNLFYCLVGYADALTQGEGQLRLRSNAARALAIFEDARAIAVAMHLEVDDALIAGNIANIHLECGRPLEAEQLAQKAVDVLGPLGDRVEPNAFISRAIHAEVKAELSRPGWRGDVERALAHHEQLSVVYRNQSAEVRRHAAKLHARLEAGREATTDRLT